MHLVARGLDFGAGGSLFFGEALQGVVLGGGLLQVETRALQAGFDIGEIGRAAAGLQRRERRPRLGDFGLGGFDIGLQGGVGDGGQGLPLADALPFVDVELVDNAGDFGAHRLPLERLDLAVGRQGTDKRLPLDARERDFRRRALAQHTPADRRRRRQQQQ